MLLGHASSSQEAVEPADVVDEQSGALELERVGEIGEVIVGVFVAQLTAASSPLRYIARALFREARDRRFGEAGRCILQLARDAACIA